MTNKNNNRRTAAANNTDRRTLLKAGALAAGATALTGRLPATALRMAKRRSVLQNPVTVVLFQRGGADQLNLYAPTGDTNYATLRPSLGVGSPGSGAPVEGLAMDATFSMHPAMSALHSAYTAPGSTVGIVHAVGHLPYDRSHFESQDLFESGALDGSLQDGWINRHLQATAAAGDPPVRALAFRPGLPRSLQGAHPAFAVRSISDLAFQGSQPDVRFYLETIVDNTPTGSMSSQRQIAYQSGADAFDLIDVFAGLDPSTYAPANGAAYPGGDLGTALREAAQVIKADLGVEFITVDQGGWDHHSDLIPRIAANATEFSEAIHAFFTDLGAIGIDVVLVAMSEFGREVRENGSAGTDHGVGGAMVVAGGQTNGGQVHGAWPGLANAALQDGRFLAPSNDFRDVLLEALSDHMGGTDASLVFPGFAHTPIGVL